MLSGPPRASPRAVPGAVSCGPRASLASGVRPRHGAGGGWSGWVRPGCAGRAAGRGAGGAGGGGTGLPGSRCPSLGGDRRGGGPCWNSAPAIRPHSAATAAGLCRLGACAGAPAAPRAGRGLRPCGGAGVVPSGMGTAGTGGTAGPTGIVRSGQGWAKGAGPPAPPAPGAGSCLPLPLLPTAAGGGRRGSAPRATWWAGGGAVAQATAESILHP